MEIFNRSYKNQGVMLYVLINRFGNHPVMPGYLRKRFLTNF